MTGFSFGSTPFSASFGEVVGPLLVSETVTVGDALVNVVYPALIERMTVVEALSTSSATAIDVADGWTSSDAVLVAWQMIVSEGLDLSGQPTDIIAFVTMVEDVLQAAGLVDSRQDAVMALIEGLVLESLARSGWTVAALQQATVSAAIVPAIESVVALLDTIELDAPTAPSLRIIGLVSADIDVSATLSTTAQLFEAIASGASFAAMVSLGGVEYSTFVMNLKTQAVVEYENFAFNSYARFGQSWVGANQFGLFELVGDDDDGDPITAWVRSALSNLGTGLVKRLPSMYVGYKSADVMVLKVVHTSESGTKTEDWYEARPTTAGATRENRIKVGRGPKSVYWAFELRNVDGADFSLDSVELYPMILSRRLA